MSPEPVDGHAADVLVVGSVNVDRIVHVDRHPRPGETLVAARHEVAPGGKGANQAVGVARAGGRVRLVALVGDDEDGRATCAGLRQQGVDVAGVRTVPGRTGTALITVDAAGENTIVVVPGANHSRRWEDLPGGPLPPARSLLLQAELPVPVLDRFVRAAGDRLTVLNLAPYTPLPPGLLQLVDVLVVNEHEAAALLQEPAPRSPDQAADAAARLRALGPGVVVVTLGAQGAVAADGRTVVCEAALPVPVVDTVGAGDSFVAALTLVLGRGGPLVAAVRAGVAAAALTVQHPGAQPPPPAPPPVPPRDQPTSAA